MITSGNQMGFMASIPFHRETHVKWDALMVVRFGARWEKFEGLESKDFLHLFIDCIGPEGVPIMLVEQVSLLVLKR